MREGSGVGAQMWEGIGVKHCEVQVVRGGAGGQGPLKSNEIEQQQWTKNLRAWEGPSAHGGEGGSKNGSGIVGGGSEASRESKTRRSERMAGWFGCGRGSGRAR
jgi:hypothetical protein